MKILVVDDSSVMRKLIARSVSSAEGPDVEVVEAEDGMRALAMIARHGTSIDLILCDTNMPNVDGLSLLRSLRSTPSFKHIPFILVTADDSDESVARAVREGAAGVIGKPFRQEEMAAMVRSRRSHGKRSTSGALKTDTVTRMLRAMTRSASRSVDGSGAGGSRAGTDSERPVHRGADGEGGGSWRSAVS